MRLIIGLGNPGQQYASTRHNLGFMVADKLASDLKADFKLWGPGKICDLAQTSLGGEKILLLKPLTFMNLSGQAAVAVASFFKVLPDEIVAVHDEVDLPFGDVRLKIGGGEGGHNGLKSLTKSLSSAQYARIRMGVGRPPHPGMETADFVLAPFGNADWPTVDDMVERAIQGITAFAKGNDAFTREMNRLNQKKKDT
ncbi:MAG: aminoacyl-tRNA hydrolase [Deltaproteobacteria bacterium]|nr:aminoacyl-tRNA hydrolase [Deltaproteobacteria bacterium]